MRRPISTGFVLAAATLAAHLGAFATATSAAAAEAPAQFQRQETLRANGGDRAVQQIVTRIRTDADTLRRALDNARGRQDRSNRFPDDVQYAVNDVITAADHLSDHSARNQVFATDVDDLLRRGSVLESSVSNGAQAPAVRNAWMALRRDLDQMASVFGQRWDWGNPPPASTGNSPYNDRLSGTYELVPSQSDNPRRTINQAVHGNGQLRRQLEERLDPPSVISIERTGNRITLASSDAPRASFDANGRQISERRGNRTATMRASVYGDRVEVTTNGGDDDFTATFEPLDNGRSMRLTRQLFASGLQQPIVVRSVYRRTSDRPDWSVFGDRNRPIGTSGRSNGPVDDGTLLTATLDTPVNIRSVRENDRVTLTVHNAPSAQLENAVLEGYVTSTPANGGGTSQLGVAFNRIRLTNGRTADFSGAVENVRGPNGEAISFDGEQIDNNDQRDDAIQRGAIGAAVGAIIGAIAGGGKGAAIGAAVGAGGGAATVLINGQRQTDLPRGTQFTIRARGSSDWNR